METTSAIDLLLTRLKALQSSPANYQVPNLWNSEVTGATEHSPASWFIERIEAIQQSGNSTPHFALKENWHKSAVVYNLFVRFGTAFDHDGDGTISREPLSSGFRETGTLLKAIALLPYIKKLGANTLYLLPLTEIGTANRKGSLGSPYAIKDPMKLDPKLAEPALDLKNWRVNFNNMKSTVNFNQFCDGFPESYQNNFSYEGKKALFNYLEEYEDATGEQIEFDPIALCCEYTEYKNIDDLQDQYPDIETIDDLQQHTQVIEVPERDAIIIQDY